MSTFKLLQINKQNNIYCKNMSPLHRLFALSLFWWPEPLRIISGSKVSYYWGRPCALEKGSVRTLAFHSDTYRTLWKGPASADGEGGNRTSTNSSQSQASKRLSYLDFDDKSQIPIGCGYPFFLGLYKLVVLHTSWYRVSIGLLCLYKLKKWRLGHMSQMCLSWVTQKEISS